MSLHSQSDQRPLTKARSPQSHVQSSQDEEAAAHTNWVKKGRIFTPDNNTDWMVSHANFPVVDAVDAETLRIYLGVRDGDGYTRTTYIEVDADDPSTVKHVRDEEPVLGFGDLGAFDDTGVHPSWILDHGGMKYLYYTGWNAGVSVGYRNSIGLAISDDGGETFTRMFKGPLVDRTPTEPQWTSTPAVMIDQGVWRMWYLNATHWERIDGKPEPVCHIKYAESNDGIHWQRDGIVCIDLASEEEGAIARPCVLFEDGIYKMWYSYRGRRDYRSDPSQSYRIGYAESDDGISWTRKDDAAGIGVSATGWDSQMVEYAFVYNHQGTRYLFYNGNGFGESGLGYAVAEE